MSGAEHCCQQFADLSGLSVDEVRRVGSCDCIQAKEELKALEKKYATLLKSQQRAGLQEIGAISDRTCSEHLQANSPEKPDSSDPNDPHHAGHESSKPLICAYCLSPGRPWRKDASCDCLDYECGSAFDCGESVTEPRGFRRSTACVRIENLQDELSGLQSVLQKAQNFADLWVAPKRIQELEAECLRLRKERDDIKLDTEARLAGEDIETSGLALLAETIMDEALHRPEDRVWQVFSIMAKAALEEVDIFYSPFMQLAVDGTTTTGRDEVLQDGASDD